jgi:hypothetical protein
VRPFPPPEHEPSGLPARRTAVALTVSACVLAALALAFTAGGSAREGAASPLARAVAPAEPGAEATPTIEPPGGASAPAPPREGPAPRREPAQPRPSTGPSRALGQPFAGRLEGGVALTPEGEHFFSWDPVLRIHPNREWRRFGTRVLVRGIEGVLANYRAANPGAPRVGIGDLSRPRGGPFGARFGSLGHGSHQNGLDVDIYYPRRDGLEMPPDSPEQIDRRLAQDLVDRWVRAGAQFVFVGPRTGLTGPRGTVQRLVYHDDHLHVRIHPPRR